MSDFQTEGDNTVAVDTAEDGGQEDRYYDTLEDAVEALGDDDEGEGEEPEAEADEDSAEEPGAAVLTLSDGTELTLEEVEKGHLRMQDYTRKTTEVAREREALKERETTLTERARSIETASQRLVALVQQLIPPMPEPALARTNPGLYTQQRVMHEQAQAEIAAWMQAGQETKQAVQALTETQVAQRRADADTELAKAMPRLKDPAALAKFNDDVKAVASQFGFDEAMIAATIDPRVRRMAYYAGIGMRAEENRKAASKRVEAARVGKPPAPAKPTDQSRKAMRRLSQTGSIKDALSIDF